MFIKNGSYKNHLITNLLLEHKIQTFKIKNLNMIFLVIRFCIQKKMSILKRMLL